MIKGQFAGVVHDAVCMVSDIAKTDEIVGQSVIEVLDLLI